MATNMAIKIITALIQVVMRLQPTGPDGMTILYSSQGAENNMAGGMALKHIRQQF